MYGRSHCGPPFRVLGIQHVADVIHLDHVGEIA
jgi:hypothetical protein